MSLAEDVDDVLANLDDSVLSVVDTVAENPLIVFVGAAVIFLPVLVSLLLKGKGYAGDLSPKDAIAALGEEGSLLLDIRNKAQKVEDGSPSIKALKKKPLNIVYEIEDEEGAIIVNPDFSSVLTAAKGVTTDSKIIVIDKTGSSSVSAAKDLTKSGFKNVYAILGGADSWKENGLPWLKPSPAFKLDLGAIKEALTSSVEDNGLLTASLGVAAAAGASVVLASEVEVALQLLGSAALIQLLLKKFLFAKDRKETLAQIKAFLDTQVAPSELVDDLQEIGAALLPGGSKQDAAELVAELTGVSTEVAVETEPTSEPLPPAAKSSTDFPPAPRPLSPYAQYEDLKPPTSPTPRPPTPLTSEPVSESTPVAEPAAPSAAAAKSSTDFPPSPTPLSPYTQYADLKPPTSPSPSRPAPTAPPAVDSTTVTPSVAATEAVKSSTDFPPAPRPLSPYALYEDLKPPTSPTPSPPTSEVPIAGAPEIVDPAAVPTVSVTSSTDFPPAPRPLSPYALYEDLKPPTSPTPSKPE